jgi:hypothetical protein
VVNAIPSAGLTATAAFGITSTALIALAMPGTTPPNTRQPMQRILRSQALPGGMIALSVRLQQQSLFVWFLVAGSVPALLGLIGYNITIEIFR